MRRRSRTSGGNAVDTSTSWRRRRRMASSANRGLLGSGPGKVTTSPKRCGRRLAGTLERLRKKTRREGNPAATPKDEPARSGRQSTEANSGLRRSGRSLAGTTAGTAPAQRCVGGQRRNVASVIATARKERSFRSHLEAQGAGSGSRKPLDRVGERLNHYWLDTETSRT